MPSTLLTLIANPAEHGLDRVVAFDAINSITGADLLRKVDKWRNRLAALAETAILLHQPRGEELLAALLASWQLSKIAVLPATSPNAVLRALDLPPLDVTIGELAQGIPANRLPDYTDAKPALVMFTSGSSGAPTPVTKSLAQLDAELELLERMWGNTIGESVIVSGVSRQHMFGLPFSLLWPLARGNPFFADTVYHAESLETLARRFGAITLVTSPGQLDHLPHNLDWPLLRAHLGAIFCAGAPLAMATAQLCRDQLVPVIEIYGSTETGAVAWRDQTAELLWRCLPEVEVSVETGPETPELESSLRISSPCIHPVGEDWLTVADRGRLHPDNRFELLGRTDRIAKVGGKRVSVTAVEASLRSHPWVIDAQVLPLAERKGRLGAVVVFNSTGRKHLIDQGRAATNRLLCAHLAPHLDAVAVPRYWRYVGRLPVDAQGKSGTSQAEELFLSERQPRLPVVCDTRFDGESDSARIGLRIPDTLFYFSGHFPGNPILPGVVQLDWVLQHARQLFGDIGNFQRLENLKFQRVIQPGDLVNLDLNWDGSRSRLTFAFSSSGHKHSSGRVAFTRNE